jgi:hypothetical protein
MELSGAGDHGITVIRNRPWNAAALFVCLGLSVFGSGCSAQNDGAAGASSTAPALPEVSKTAADAPRGSTNNVGSVDIPQMPCADGAVSVAAKYMEAVQAGNAAQALRCQVTGGGPAGERIATLRDWGVLLIDDAEIADEFASGTVTVRIPSPPTPNIGEGGGTTIQMADHQSGVLITLIADPRPDYYVADVSFYASD